MSEYLKRHRMFVTNEQRLREELRRLEGQLSGHLTILKNSLLYDGQMSSRGFKIWVNGASFHVQMLIHEARLDFSWCVLAEVRSSVAPLVLAQRYCNNIHHISLSDLHPRATVARLPQLLRCALMSLRNGRSSSVGDQ
ncbi:uncharacterized protein AKAME5_002249700 [Lates japonicus]|uniref:Uncharacterized protein n=1 Tax=Lates japonicus TaxID=270547 RepID=A0AAD3RJX4_LATJO|nr:uncharacterized protein AKAME5_002249700 [Lates japonicus]